MGDEGSSAVKAFYRGANVLLTGGTGFVGMGIVEKLLRVCPDVGTVFLLMRPKRGKSPAERLQDLAKNPLFETLVEMRGEGVFERLQVVEGDVSAEGLGLSAADRARLAAAVHVVLHSAATLDFDTPLAATVNTNLLGTRRVLQLCREMTNLKAMVHVSSAYVNSNRTDVEEILYPIDQDADKLIELTNTMTEQALEELAPSLCGDLPNAYALTKALAEQEVSKECSSFPCAIVRPSMITAAWKEPVPGWTNSKNGPTGFMMGAAKGVVRRLPVCTKLICDYIPVDVVVNEVLVAAWYAATERSTTVPVFHCTSSTCNPFRWQTVEEHVNTYLHRFPLTSAVWYPYLKFLPSLMIFRIAAFFVHMIPAYILDFVTLIAGGKPILVKLHTNVNRSLGRLAPFIFNEWHFSNDNTQQLSKAMNVVDQQLFFLDISSLQWESYFISLAQGVRRYLNKEHPRSLKKAQRKDKILLVLHILLQLLLCFSVWWLTSCATASPVKASVVAVVAYSLFSLL
ncbi:Putative fatty acyl-CoA reductase CG8306 [Gryllus bimaculatus]|nr:Putative fatty acyl-CoA reductase CG8306 [Gryllus bimaculatus]